MIKDYFIFKHKTTEIDEDKIKDFTTNDEFNEIGIEILKEINSLIIPIATICKIDENGNKIPYNHEEAALIGNLVRYCKLCTAFLEQYAIGRVETSLIFLRCISETYVNLKYFLKFKDNHTIRHYIKDSLRQEKDLLEIIRQNIQDKNEIQKIEERMLASINKSFGKSEFNEDEVNNSSKWNSKIKARINEIFPPQFYVLMYGTASHSIHGNWQDLIDFHLIKEGDGFLPDARWTHPTMQILHATIFISCDILQNYAWEVLPADEKRDALLLNINDILNRSFKLDKLHENYMQSKQ